MLERRPTMTDTRLYQVEEGWIETLSGRRFHFENPRVDDVDLYDVATVLSRLCRYNGHTIRWYSVAEHCCLMADWTMRQPGAAPRDGLTALHHDDAEYIIGDLVRPIKVTLPDFKEIETRIDRAVALRFGTEYPFPQWLKDADSRILRDERIHVMNPSGNNWGIDGLEPLGVRFMPLSGRVRWLIRWQWLRRHHRLTRLTEGEPCAELWHGAAA